MNRQRLGFEIFRWLWILLALLAVFIGLSWSLSAQDRANDTDSNEAANQPNEDEEDDDQSNDADQPDDDDGVDVDEGDLKPESRVKIEVDPKTGDIIVTKLETESESEEEDSEEADDEIGSFFSRLQLDSIWTRNGWERWLFLLIALFVGVLAGRVVAFVLRKLGDNWTKKGWKVRGLTFSGAASPTNLVLMTAGATVGVFQMKLSDPLYQFTGSVAGMLVLIALFWYTYNLVEVIEIVLKRLTATTESTLDDQLVPLIRKTLRLFIVIVGVLVILEVVFKADVGAAIAGLGIAGLAVSLAAQDSLKNLFGSITILFDQPFQVGERIQFRDIDGVVEEIGFRSTKVRTGAGHLVTIPNSALVNDPVENIGARGFIRRIMNLTLTYDTPPEKVEEGVHIVRELLESDEFREPIHAEVNGNEYPPRVYFNDLTPDSLNIFVIYWYAPPAWWDYLEHAQRLHLELLKRFEQAGIEFAFPTQTIQLTGDEKRELAVRLLERDSPES